MVARAPYRYAAPGPPEPAEPGVSICRGCGVVAPAEGRACEVCKRPLAETRVEVPAQGGDLFWVAVRCGFTCNSCRFLAPLDCIDVDGAVECAQCGLRQRFDVDAWPAALALAHAVGDLAGPAPEGRKPHPALWIGSENPHATIGTTRTFERLSGSVLSMEAAPGQPICHKCQWPLTISVTAPGAVATSCARCGDRATYEIPDRARHLDDALMGAIAHDHRTDQRKAQSTGSEAGAMTLGCPSCGAPLRLQGTDRLQTCPFCRASCIVPARSFLHRGGDVPEPEVWWMLFRGPSAKRAELEAPTAAAAPDLEVALKLLKPGGGSTAIGEAPGVYPAPEVPGTNWLQVAFTLFLGSIALVFGYLVLGR